MRKMILVLVALLVIGGTSVFAYGQQEGAPEQLDRPRYAWEEQDVLSLTGQLDLEHLQPPVLKTDGKEYVLMYPPFLDDNVDIKDGETVTVEGFVAPGPRWNQDNVQQNDDTLYLRVTKAVIDGEEYDLDRWGHGYGPSADGRHPRAGGRRSPRRGKS